MSKTSQFVDVHGKVKYIHALNLNKYGAWTVTLLPDSKSLEVIRDMQSEGMKNVIKKDDDNQYFVQFKREPNKLMKGKMVAFTAPRCVDVDGKPMDGSKIGWGSDVTVRLDKYYHGTPSGKKACACRWDSIRVDNLVEWTPEQLPAADKEAHNSLVNAPEPEPW